GTRSARQRQPSALRPQRWSQRVGRGVPGLVWVSFFLPFAAIECAIGEWVSSSMTGDSRSEIMRELLQFLGLRWIHVTGRAAEQLPALLAACCRDALLDALYASGHPHSQSSSDAMTF